MGFWECGRSRKNEISSVRTISHRLSLIEQASGHITLQGIRMSCITYQFTLIILSAKDHELLLSESEEILIAHAGKVHVLTKCDQNLTKIYLVNLN